MNPEKDSHILDEAKRAIREGDSERAEQLEATVGSVEMQGGEINFVKASEQMIGLGADQCMVVHKLPESLNFEHLTEYEGYLEREARRQHAMFLNENENHRPYFVVQFPGRPEEAYTATGFYGSVRALLMEKVRSVSDKP